MYPIHTEYDCAPVITQYNCKEDIHTEFSFVLAAVLLLIYVRTARRYFFSISSPFSALFLRVHFIFHRRRNVSSLNNCCVGRRTLRNGCAAQLCLSPQNDRNNSTCALTPWCSQSLYLTRATDGRKSYSLLRAGELVVSEAAKRFS